MKQLQTHLNMKQSIVAWCSFAFRLLPVLIVLCWAGCKQEAKVTADASPVGTYKLVSIDGKPVPCSVQHEGHTMGIQSGSFEINADGTCSSKMFLSGRNSPIEVKASYSREGPKLTMRWEGAGTTIGTIEGDTFTMNNEGMVLAYRK